MPFGLLAILGVCSAPAPAADDLFPQTVPVQGEDLTFPAAPQPFGAAKASRMFKPAGAGPFPGLVILPTCGGHQWRHSFDVWAKAALERGYAVLVVDPLTPRGVVAPGENCRPPNKVSTSRYRKDGFDAAEHLRKQPFVDPERIGLLGMSLGAMAGLGAASDIYAAPQGRRPFRAIVGLYPVCFLGNVRLPGRSRPANVHWMPYRITVPLLVQMGELDTEALPRDCVPLLQKQKDQGAPVEYVVHKNATHNWDEPSLKNRTFKKKSPFGPGEIVYRYNPEVTRESIKQTFDFLDRHTARVGR